MTALGTPSLAGARPKVMPSYGNRSGSISAGIARPAPSNPPTERVPSRLATLTSYRSDTVRDVGPITPVVPRRSFTAKLLIAYGVSDVERAPLIVIAPPIGCSCPSTSLDPTSRVGKLTRTLG